MKGMVAYKKIKGAGERAIRMTKPLEQLENVGRRKEMLRLKWKKRSSSGCWPGGHGIGGWA